MRISFACFPDWCSTRLHSIQPQRHGQKETICGALDCERLSTVAMAWSAYSAYTAHPYYFAFALDYVNGNILPTYFTHVIYLYLTLTWHSIFWLLLKLTLYVFKEIKEQTQPGKMANYHENLYCLIGKHTIRIVNIRPISEIG